MKTLKLEFLEDYRDIGLLLMRLGVGASFIVHGWPKMSGGPQSWKDLGGTLEAVFGIGFLPEFWGFMAAFAEFGGGILLILGLLVRPAAFLMACTMGVALMSHLHGGDDFKAYSHALELGFVFVGLFFLGGGKYGVDAHLK